MYLFLITFLLLYGGMHFYAFTKLRNVFRVSKSLKWPLILWMIFMTAIPLLVRIAEQFSLDKTAVFIAWPGYLWMGLLFICASALLFTDVVRIVYGITFRRHCSFSVPHYISSHNATKTVLITAAIASIYACIEAGRIRSEHVVITSAKLQPAASRIRIVQISDVHFGLLLQKWRLQSILETIRQAKPDILISTGDLVDGKLNRVDAISRLNEMAALLASVPAPYGKFAVIGNHEVYAGISQALGVSKAAGFTILRNQSIPLQYGITITGIDDSAVNLKASADPTIETALLRTVSPNSFHILLKHRPDLLPESDGRFDLQLSGHVHGGQIFPFNFLVKFKYPIACGTTITKKGSNIYVSRGTGTWGPPMRLFAPPEITIIDIIPQTKNVFK